MRISLKEEKKRSCPDEIRERSICIDGDIGEVIENMEGRYDRKNEMAERA